MRIAGLGPAVFAAIMIVLGILGLMPRYGIRYPEEIQRAITMTQNVREQELLAGRLKQIEKAALSA